MDHVACGLIEVVPKLLGGVIFLIVDNRGKKTRPIENVGFGEPIRLFLDSGMQKDHVIYFDVMVGSTKMLGFVKCGVKKTVGFPVVDGLVLLMVNDRLIQRVRAMWRLTRREE